MQDWYSKINRRSSAIDSVVGVWLDTLNKNIPDDFFDWEFISDPAERIFRFNEAVMKAVSPHIVDVKINSSFYMWSAEREALKTTFELIRTKYPNIFTICDGKFADVWHTSEEIVQYVFDTLEADAIMANPYLWWDSIEIFSERADKTVILCVNTSNPGAKDIQELVLSDGEPLWKYILRLSMGAWNKNRNIVPVLSSTHPENLLGIRKIIWDSPMVLAGAWLQGGDLAASIPHCIKHDGKGVMVSSSRWIIHAPRKNDESYTDAMERIVIDMKTRINSIAHPL